MRAAILAAAVGYLLGRARPLEEARRRTTFTIRFGRPWGKPLGWRHLTAWTVLHPIRGTRSLWRAFVRGQGEPERPEPVPLSEVFKEKS